MKRLPADAMFDTVEPEEHPATGKRRRWLEVRKIAASYAGRRHAKAVARIPQRKEAEPDASGGRIPMC